MRIVYDMVAMQNTSRFRGIGRFVNNLARALIHHRGTHEIFLLINGTHTESAFAIRQAFGTWLPEENFIYWYSPDADDQWISEELYRKTGKIYAHAVLSCQPDYLIKAGGLFADMKKDDVFSTYELNGKTGLATVVHDFIPKENPEKYGVASETYNTQFKAHEKMDILFTLSEFTKKECLTFFPDKPVYHISSGADPLFLSSVPDKTSPFPEIVKPFVLYCGGPDERKNIPMLIHAYASLPVSTKQDHQLVIVFGKNHLKELNAIKKNLNDSGLGHNDYVLLEYVSDKALLWLYSRCKLFCFPSLAEGFGLPPLEAMSCGAATIASNTTSLPEVIGKAEALFNPWDKAGLTALMNRALTDADFLEALRQHARKQSPLFSFDKTAQKMIDTLAGTTLPERKNNTHQSNDLLSFCRELALPPMPDNQIILLARSVSRTLKLEPKKIFVDVSNAYKSNRVTGIPRVVRSVTGCLVNMSLDYEICPVCLTKQGYIRVQDFLTEAYGIKQTNFSPDLHFSGNDLFLGLDLDFHDLRASHLDVFRMNRVKIYFFLHDILPLQFPDYFYDGAPAAFRKWIELISDYDGIVANSESVANDYTQWRKENGKSNKEFHISWAHLGHDLERHSIPDDDSGSADHANILNQFAASVSILMVNTIEPRKGHRQTLDAFEKLWQSGLPVNLVIVGHVGWKMDDFIKRLSSHPEKGKRLFWLSDVDDSFLIEIYKACTGVLMPSEGEGFGLSIIEGAAHQKPLMLRDIPVFKEIAGEHAYYFQGTDAENLAKRLKEWISLLEQKRAPSSDGIPKVSWMQCTENILKGIGISDFGK